MLKDVTKYGATFQPLDIEGMQAQKAQLYIDLRNTYERLYAHEAENHEENALLRRNLNTYYDEFVMRYGNLNAKHLHPRSGKPRGKRLAAPQPEHLL